MIGGGGGTRISVLCMVPRDYMACVSDSRSSDHGCAHQCGRQSVMSCHSASPLDMKSQKRLAPTGCGLSFQKPRRLASIGGRQDSFPHQLGDQRGNRFIPCARIGIGIYGLTSRVSTTHDVLSHNRCDLSLSESVRRPYPHAHALLTSTPPRHALVAFQCYLLESRGFPRLVLMLPLRRVVAKYI
jgi:hypothetical protein